MRVRALVALISTEILGTAMPLPDFPVMKGIRGIGMSDSPQLASRLAEKFDYTNTFYHQAPFFDVTRPAEADAVRFDFIVSSEVMEHVPPPVEQAFSNLHQLLKTDGLLLLTTPYTIDGKSVEHFPELHEYTLANPGGRTVLINRRKDGSLEIFDNLVFHGGPGSTLELRVFSEPSLIQMLKCAGFETVRIACENLPEFGVQHAETWSLPIAARKGSFRAPTKEVVIQYRDARRRAELAEATLAALRADYEKYIDFHQTSHDELNRDLSARLEWGRKLEADLEERTKWALSLRNEQAETVKALEHAQRSEAEAWDCVKALEKELDETRAGKVHLETRRWTKIGRRLKLVP
jgi:SAM-dependent methyltransferase